MAETRNTLSFHGKGSTLFGLYLVNILLSVVTLGIYSFWGKVKILQYQYDQSQLNGSPFRFLGTGGQMFAGYLKFLAVLLVFVALPTGIFFAVVFNMAMGGGMSDPSDLLGMFIVFYIYLILLLCVLVPMAANGWFRYRLKTSSWRGLTGQYRGLNKELIPMYLLGLFLTLITLGIYGAWFQVKVQRYIYSKLHYGNLTLEFTGSGGQLFVIGLKGLFFMIITLGIYWFWYARNVYRWTAEHTQVVQNGNQHALSTPVTAGALFGFLLKNMLLLIITLGIYFPWYTVNSQKFLFANLTLPDGLDLESLNQGEAQAGDATGEALSDFLDLGDFGIL